MRVRIATFNAENLFARYKFKGTSTAGASADGFTINETKFSFHGDTKREITGKTIKAIAADVIALQEVENLDVLKRFRSAHLGGSKAYPHVMLVDGNDPRYIDVALLSKYPIVCARSYQHVKRSPRSFTFSRDCLEADIDVGGATITMYVNHFKSMIGGRSQTKQRRLDQVEAVRKIITDRFGSKNPGFHPFVVLGDFNDYIETGRESESSLPRLVNWNQVENVVDRLLPSDRWTHYYSKAKEYRQLDYVLVSETLAPRVQVVEIERRGMPKRATAYGGPHFPGVGQKEPKASDHCPVVVELDI